MNKKKLFLWCLYDFANSFAFVNVFMYFTRWLVVDGGLPDLAFQFIFIISAAISLFVGPCLASRTDKNGGLVRNLSASTFGVIACLAGAVLCAMAGLDVWLSALLFLIGEILYTFSFMFFTPLLIDVADEKHRARASGWAQFSNGVGMVLGLVLFMPLASYGRLAPLLPALGAFALLSLPMLLLYKEPAKERLAKGKIKIGFDWKKFAALWSIPAIAPLLLAFFFYNDALVTIQNNFSVYAAQVFGATDKSTAVMMAVISLMNAVGALAAGAISDKIGSRRTLVFGLCAWAVIIPLLAAAPTWSATSALAALVGLFLGINWNASRAYMSLILPKDKIAYGFSFYVIFERFSSIIGPLAWGLIVAAGGSYRLALGSMAIFVSLGAIALLRGEKIKIK